MADDEQLAALYDVHVDRLYGYLRARVANDHDAEDLTAETFLRAFGGLPQFRARHAGATSAWLFRIAHNLLHNFHRQQRRAATLSLEELPMHPAAPDDPAAAAEHAELRDRLLALIAGLPPRHQEVIALKYFGDLRNHEIADVLALDQRTVAAYLTRALAELQRRGRGLTMPGAMELAAEAQEDLVATRLRRSYTGLRNGDEAGVEQALRAGAPVASTAFRAALRARLEAPRPPLLERILRRLRGRSR